MELENHMVLNVPDCGEAKPSRCTDCGRVIPDPVDDESMQTCKQCIEAWQQEVDEDSICMGCGEHNPSWSAHGVSLCPPCQADYEDHLREQDREKAWDAFAKEMADITKTALTSC